MAIPFLNGIDVTGTVDLSNLTIDGAQGTDGQVLTSTGSGIAWEDASGGSASLSGGEASKVAIWSATDTLTHHDSFHFNTSNTRLGIGTEFPNYTLDVAGNIGLAQYGYIYFGSNSSNQLRLSNSLSGAQVTQSGSGDLGLNSASNGIVFLAGGAAKAKLLSSGNFGIGDTNPNRPLVVSETRTGSTASDAYTTVVKSVQSSGASPNPGTGGLKVQYTSSSSNVHAFGLVAGSSSSDFLTTGPMHFYTNSDLDTVSASGYAMQLDTSQRLSIGSVTASQKLNVGGNVTADRYYGNSATNYYIDPNEGTGASAVLNGAVSIGSTSTYTKLSVTTPAGYGSGADGIFIRSTFAGSSPVVSDKDPFLSIGCSDSSGSVSTIFMGEDGTATSQESKIEYSHDNSTLGIFVAGQGSYREHVRFGEQSSSQARTRFYGNVGIGTNPGHNLDVFGTVRLGHSSSQTTRFGAYGTLLSTDTHISHNLYWNNGWQVISSSVPSSSIRLGGTSSNEIQLQFAAAGSASASTQVYFTSSGIGQATGSFRAPIFYDSNNVAYYLDPASSSVALNINGKIAQAKEDWNIDGSHSNAIFQANRATQTNRGSWPGSYYYGVNFGDRTKGIQLAASYSSAKNLYFRSGTDNSGAENGANAWKNWRQLFHDDYHPNADKWTTARTLTLNGDVSGSVSWDGSGNATLTTAVANDSHTHDNRYYTETESDSRFVNVTGDTMSGTLTITGSSGASRLRIEGTTPTIDFDDSNGDSFYIHVNANNFYVLADRDGGGNYSNWESPHPLQLEADTNTGYLFGDRILTVDDEGAGNGLDADLLDGQHGSYYYSSANLPTKIKAGGNGPSTENLNTVANSVSTGQLEYRGFNSSSSNKPPTSDNANGVITVGQHSGNYNAQLAFSSDGNIYWRDNPSSSFGSWRKMWDEGNDGSGSGLDADLLDGNHASAFATASHNHDSRYLRSNANDTATGSITINTTGIALTATSQQSIGAVITGGNNSQDIIQLKKGTNVEAKLDTGGHWHVDGDVIAYSTTISSDKKLKTNISTLTNALDKTIKLRGVNFDWIDENKPNNQVGFIAQEVEEVLPEVVKDVETLNKENEKHKAVDYAAVVPLLVEAIKEQQKQIDELKSIINGGS